MEQIDIFETLFKQYKITKPIRLIELFGGIGSQSAAFENLEKKGKMPNGFRRWKYCDFDKYAVNSYNAIHNTNFEPTDITQIHAKDLDIRERERVEYVLTYSFPCQDLSIAGKQKGLAKGSGTRSGLLWEVERLLIECGTELPQILLLENVKNLASKKFIPQFKSWLQFLESKGYTNYWQILNAKDYGIPQNRKRVFCVSILGNDFGYNFPQEKTSELKMNDLLEKNVDKKYYLSEKMIDYISSKGTSNFSNPDCKINLDIARPLTTGPNKRAGTTNYISNDLPSNFDLLSIDSMQREKLAIRRLTPKEYWRLMGFTDEQFEKAAKINSDAQLYKQAGNSIVVNVLEAIIEQLL